MKQFSLIFASFFLLLPTVSIEASNLEQCESLWNQINNNSELSLSNKISTWKDYENDCSPSTVFQYGLARFYLQNKDTKNVRKIITNIKKTPLHKEFNLLHVEADFTDLAFSNNPNQDEINKLRNSYDNIIKSYPNWYKGYEAYSFFTLGIKEYKSTIKLSEKSIDLKPTAAAYRNLAIASLQLDKYQKVIDSGSKAFKYDSSFASDRDMMLSIAVAYASIGSYEKSKIVLEGLVERRPELINDDGILNLVRYLKSRISK